MPTSRWWNIIDDLQKNKSSVFIGWAVLEFACWLTTLRTRLVTRIYSQNLFNSLGFHMEVKRDLSMMNIIEVAQEFAKKDHSSYESFIFIALSQCGPGELIVGVDGRKVILEQVMSEFRPCNSTSLKNKPKLFFILRFVNLKTQSAERRSGGTEFFTDTTIALPHSCNTSIQEVCSEEADFLVACATSPIVKEKKITLPQHSFIEVRLSV